MSKMNKVYNLTIKTLTPLHIDSGNTLLLDYDYVKYRGQTWVVNEDALAELLISEDASAFERMINGRPASELLQKDDYRSDSDLFRYVMTGETSAKNSGSPIQEQIKDAWDRPYIPGSSLKGALRTALTAVSLGQQSDTNLQNLGKKPGQTVENQVLYGRETNPFYDLMRALQIADSTPDPDQMLRLLNVQAVKRKDDDNGPRIALEGIPNGRTFQARMVIDHYILDSVGAKLGFSNNQALLLQDIMSAVNEFTYFRLKRERSHWKPNPVMYNFYNVFSQEFNKAISEGEFFLQLGWGGGWDSKTIGVLLRRDKENLAKIVNDYRLQPQRKRNNPFKPGDRFPTTRRIVMKDGQPHRPLGWVRVKMEEVS